MSIVGSEQWMYSSGQEFYDFPLEQSLRVAYGDNPKLSRTNSSAPTNNSKGTLSFWMKRGLIGSGTGNNQYIIHTGSGTSNDTHMDLKIETGDILSIGAYSNTPITGTPKLRDVSSWYHIVVKFDSTSATASERQIKVYINGVEMAGTKGPVAQNQKFPWINQSQEINIFRHVSVNRPYDGYIAEMQLIDGQALDPTSFGEFKSGIWIPKDTSGLTFGTNGFRLAYADSGAIGDDTSGNTNDWTANNLVASDVVLDSPTNNFAVLAPVNNPTDVYAEGRLKFQGLTSATSPYSTSVLGTFGVSSGKWYYEARANTRSNGVSIGFAREGLMPADGSSPSYKVFGFDIFDNIVTTNNSNTNDFTVTGAAGDILGLAIDIDNGTASAYINGTLKGSVTGLNTSGYQNLPYATLGWASGGQTMTMNFGQDSTFAGNTTAGGNTDENGYGDFKYAPPSGFLSLCSANLPTGAIDTLADETPEDYFNTVLYTGNGSTRSITGVGFQPDFVWFKARSSAIGHLFYDSVRGATKYLQSASTSAEGTGSDSLTSFDSDGFSLGADTSTTGVNQSSTTYAAWNWKANGSGVSNTDGSITSTVSVGATSQQNWFSIVGYTGNATAGATVGHGLGVTPDMIIVKGRGVVSNWFVYHSANTSQPETEYLTLETTNATTDNSTTWNDTAPTSSVFSIGQSGWNNTSGIDYIAYCFANAEGLCKVGKFSGNGSTTDGVFVYTGFRPSYLLYKQTTAAANWEIIDNTRNPYNVSDARLFPSSSLAENTAETVVDLLSNGFKARDAYGGWNSSGQDYIYLAIAEQPFKYANAR